MSTRGIYGFRLNETDKLAYSHADSYPDVLGATVLNQLSEVDNWPTVKGLVESIVPTTKLGSSVKTMKSFRQNYDDTTRISNMTAILRISTT